MTTKNNQISNSASEQQFGNDDNESNIAQLLSIGIINTNQPFVPIATTNIILTTNRTLPNHQKPDNLTKRHEGRQRRRKRRRQRRRQQQQ